MMQSPAERAARREVVHEIERILDDIDVPMYDEYGPLFGGCVVGFSRLCDVVNTSQLASMILDGMQADPITRPALRLVVGGA